MKHKENAPPRTERRPALPLTAAALLLAAATLVAVPAAHGQDRRHETVHETHYRVLTGEPGAKTVFLDAEGRGFLGLQVLALTPELRSFFGAGSDGTGGDGGVLVARVTPGSPAEAAGVRVGDVLTHVDAEPIRDTLSLVARIRPRAEGDRAVLRLLRDGRLRKLTAVLVEREPRRVEVSRFLEWHEMREEDGEKRELRLHFQPEGGPGGSAEMEIDREISLDPQILARLESRLEDFDWTQLEKSLACPDVEKQREMEERIADLEGRLARLSAALEKALAQKR